MSSLLSDVLQQHMVTRRKWILTSRPNMAWPIASPPVPSPNPLRIPWVITWKICRCFPTSKWLRWLLPKPVFGYKSMACFCHQRQCAALCAGSARQKWSMTVRQTRCDAPQTSALPILGCLIQKQCSLRFTQLCLLVTRFSMICSWFVPSYCLCSQLQTEQRLRRAHVAWTATILRRFLSRSRNMVQGHSSSFGIYRLLDCYPYVFCILLYFDHAFCAPSFFTHADSAAKPRNTYIPKKQAFSRT